jgi:hypothetical protein
MQAMGSSLAWWRLWLAMAETTYWSTLTVSARLALIGTSLAARGVMPAAETARMVNEKPLTLSTAALAAMRAAAKGPLTPDRLVAATTAGLRPIRRKTRSNARRLAK